MTVQSGTDTGASVLSLLAVVRDRASARCTRNVVERYPGLASDVQVDGDPLKAVLEREVDGTAILLLELTHFDDGVLKSVAYLVDRYGPNASVIVLLEEPTTDITRHLFHAGVTDVVALPLDEAALKPAIDYARDHAARSGSQRTGRIVTMLKSAGGVGSTTLASNMAASMREEVNGPVAVVDLDLQFGMLALSLDIKPRRNILDVLAAGKRLDSTILKSVMAPHASGVDLLAAPTHLTPLSSVGPAFLESLFEILKRDYALTIVELPSSWQSWFSTVFENSDLIVMVCEASVRSASGTKRAIQCLAELSFPDAPLYLVANKVRNDADARERVSQLHNALERDISLVPYDDSAVTAANDLGELVIKSAPRSRVASQIRMVGHDVLEQLGLAAAAPRKAGGGKRGFNLFGGKR